MDKVIPICYLPDGWRVSFWRHKGTVYAIAVHSRYLPRITPVDSIPYNFNDWPKFTDTKDG